MASMAAVKPNFWANHQELASAEMHFNLNQDRRNSFDHHFWRDFDIYPTEGALSEASLRALDCNRPVFRLSA